MQQLIVDVPFIYEATVVRARKRNEETFYIRDSLPVPIPNLSPDEAVLVADTPSNTSPRHGEAPLRVEVRWHEGRLWRQEVERTAEGVSIVDESRFLEAVRSSVIQKYALAIDSLHNFRGAKGSIAEIGALRSVVGTTRDEVMAKIVQRARDVVLIGGVVHVPCGEPATKVLYGGAAQWRWLRATEVGDALDFHPGDCWKGAEWDAMLAHMAKHEELRDEEIAAMEPYRIVVHRPDLLTWEPARDNLLHDANSLLERMDGDLKDLDREVLWHWAAVRDARKATEEGAPQDGLLAALARFEGVLDAAGEGRRAEDAREILERWSARSGRPRPVDEDRLDAEAFAGLG